jgi:HEAT repeat protein
MDGRMTKSLWVLTWLLSCAVFVGCQETTPNSLQQNFRSLIEQREAGKASNFDDLLRTQRQAVNAPVKEVAVVLPMIMTALKSADLDTQINAAAVLVSIGMRSDAVEVLRGQFQSLVQLFHSPDERLQMTPIYLITELRSPLPSEVTPLLLDFIEQPERDIKAQAGAINILVRIAPQSPQVISAVKAFVAKQHEKDARILTLNALRGLRTSDGELIREVIDALNDPVEGVRFTALQVISNMGHEALLEAEPTLRKMTTNPDESADNKVLAEEDLKSLSAQPKQY